MAAIVCERGFQRKFPQGHAPACTKGHLGVRMPTPGSGIQFTADVSSGIPALALLVIWFMPETSNRSLEKRGLSPCRRLPTFQAFEVMWGAF